MEFSFSDIQAGLVSKKNEGKAGSGAGRKGQNYNNLKLLCNIKNPVGQFTFSNHLWDELGLESKGLRQFVPTKTENGKKVKDYSKGVYLLLVKDDSSDAAVILRASKGNVKARTTKIGVLVHDLVQAGIVREATSSDFVGKEGKTKTFSQFIDLVEVPLPSGTPDSFEKMFKLEKGSKLTSTAQTPDVSDSDDEEEGDEEMVAENVEAEVAEDDF